MQRGTSRLCLCDAQDLPCGRWSQSQDTLGRQPSLCPVMEAWNSLFRDLGPAPREQPLSALPQPALCEVELTPTPSSKCNVLITEGRAGMTTLAHPSGWFWCWESQFPTPLRSTSPLLGYRLWCAVICSCKPLTPQGQSAVAWAAAAPPWTFAGSHVSDLEMRL